MNLDLAVIGQGAVSPAGLGLEALRQNEPVPVIVPSVGRSRQAWPVLRIDLQHPALVQWQKEPRLRRASPLTLYLVEAARQALAQAAPSDHAETGLIVAFSTGCLVYSRRFFEAILAHGPRAASPALFPETVFNSPVSHVATVLGLNGAAYVLVGDETAWIAALKTASVWLRQERVKQVLVLGGEEFDPLALDAYRSAGWLRRQGSSPCFLASEGAAGLLVRRAQPGDSRIIAQARDDLIYRTKAEADVAAPRLWLGLDPALPYYPTAQRNWLGPLERKMAGNRPIIPDPAPYLGEAFTASSAWQTVRALDRLSNATPRLFLPVWGLNHQLGALVLERRE
jgi:hypothetical protein